MESALVYFLITAAAYPFMGVYNAGSALFRAMGNSSVSMFCSLVVNVINIAVNAIFIYGFGMGAAGAGIGTLASRIAAAIIIFKFRFIIMKSSFFAYAAFLYCLSNSIPGAPALQMPAAAFLW